TASSFPRTDWTVIWEKDPVYRVSPLNRVLYVKCAASLDEVKRNVAPFRTFLQTVGVAGNIVERKKVLEALCDSGVARVTRLGKMLEGANGSPHDGIFPMMSLVNWIGIEGRPGPLDRLIEMVGHARARSPFYRRHLSGVGRVSSLEDFHRVPFLQKEHVLENTPPDSTDLLTSKAQRGIYFASGGSTGQPKYVFYDQHEYEHTCRAVASALEAGGLGADDVIANLFVAGNLWSSWLSVEKAIANTKAISVPVGSGLPMENIVNYLRDFKVTALIGLPSFIAKLAEHVGPGRGRRGLRVGKIFYGGEYVGEEMARYFRRVFPGAAVRSAGYATADAGVVGFQCEKCSMGVHHLFSSSQYIEFVDPETRKPVQRGSVGELVVTCLNKRMMPIIRYRVGDLGRWVDGRCGCGRKEPLFEILGRCDDRIHVGGAHLFVNDIQDAIGRVPGLSFNFQIVIGRKGHKDALKIRVEAGPRSPLPAAVRSRLGGLLMAEIGNCCSDLMESVRMGWLDAPDIEVLGPGAIERVARTGKIRKVLDHRIRL
ncbi:MAG TPA: acyl-CoA reductase, partial [Elusimicrobiales bacterium]|nr:acyl-CoA reductase [Elusimicrobiales bacterium]